MGIAGIPDTLSAFRAFRERFEAERMVYADSNREVSGVTVDLVLAMSLPRASARPAVPWRCAAIAAIGAAAAHGSSRWCAAMRHGGLGLFLNRNDCRITAPQPDPSERLHDRRSGVCARPETRGRSPS